jgi:hypothetical protein
MVMRTVRITTPAVGTILASLKLRRHNCGIRRGNSWVAAVRTTITATGLKKPGPTRLCCLMPQDG